MPKLIINGEEIDVPGGSTVLQACELSGVEVPRFCFHDRLSIAGNCRMCLVEWVGSPKLHASCALSVDDLRPNRDGSPAEIRTDSSAVHKAREGVMEFLLINHPLDCPVCDQGGECDLQDQAMSYGCATNRFQENKRSVEEKYIGPLIKTVMSRCIHCTRCIRFITEVAGVSDLGAIGRGEDMEIVTYLERSMTSELQGNVIDLCPVGALTAKPYAFEMRSWELEKTETIDVMDAVGSNIRVDTRGLEVMRVLPCLNESINQEWISDKTRFILDGLKMQRLDRPYVRRDGNLVACSWNEAFSVISKRVSECADVDRIGAITGDLSSAEELFAFKDLMSRLGVKSIDCRQDGTVLHPSFGRGSYLFNPSIEGIEQSDALLLIGSNPRHEAAVLNARIRNRWRMGNFPIGVIGGVADGDFDLTYDYEYLGSDAIVLENLLDGKQDFIRVLEKASRPMIVVGQGALTHSDGLAILSMAAKLALRVKGLSAGWNGFAVLHTASARVGGLDLGLVPDADGYDVAGMIAASHSGALEILFLLGADEIDMQALGSAFVVYVGSHGDAGAHRANVILPGAAYTEKSGTYVNTEGRVQFAPRATFPVGDAREDWSILRALSSVLGKKLSYDNLDQLRDAMYISAPHLAEIDRIKSGLIRHVEALSHLPVGRLSCTPLKSTITDFYLTNPIARSSMVMADLSRQSKVAQQEMAEING